MNIPDSDSEDELPPGWEERVSVDGTVFYANHLSKLTQWNHPRTGKKKKVSGELPYGWEKCVDEPTGKILYVDHENRRTTYTDPRLAFAVEEKDHPNDFRQRFDASSTALQVLHGRDLSGQVAIITGANAGIGFETAKSLTKHGCSVVFACRNITATEDAIDEIRKEKPNAADHCRALKLDLASLSDVLAFVEEIKKTYSTIHILILNAGVFALPFSTTVDGFETTFQVCHLAHFYLTLLLQPLFIKGSRIIIVSSESHRFANLTTDSISKCALSPDTAAKYWHLTAYNNAKLCNVLFGLELARKWQHMDVSVFSLHPGNMVSSSLSRNWWLYRLVFALVRPFTKSMQQASSTTVYCATALELNAASGLYFNNCCRCAPSAASQNLEMGAELWKISIEMIQEALGPDAPGLHGLI